MKRVLAFLLVTFGWATFAAAQNAQDRSAIKCLEDSPERRGEEGCSILANRPLTVSPKREVFWHIDRFDTLADATKAAGPDSVAAEAHGGVWLMTVEGKTRNHRGGRHAVLIGPLVLPPAEGYTMNVRSTLLKQGASTPIHVHSGPEVFYVLVGEQCLETEKAGNRLTAGKFFILPTDMIHRGRVRSATLRGALTLVLHDNKRPASRDLAQSEAPTLSPCK